MRRHPIRQIEQDFIDITPAPPLRRIVALDDRMLRGVKMPGGVLVGRVVTAADVTAGAADPQMQPLAAAFEAFLAAERARRDAADAGDMRAAFCHSVSCPFVIARSATRWIASRSLSSGAHSRDPLARNDGLKILVVSAGHRMP